MDIQRVTLLKVPLHIVPPEELPAVVEYLLPPPGKQDSGQTQKGRDIVLLSLWDLLRARRSGEYRKYVLNAALVIPISKSLVNGARFLTGKTPVRYMPFNFVVSLLTLLERQEDSLYLLGGKSRILKEAEKNLHSTFPHLKIVGRYGGAIGKREKAIVTEAIRKASPSLLLLGRGVRGEELWIARNSQRLNTGLRLWCSDLFDVFAKKRQRPTDAAFEKGLECIGYCFQKPWKFLRVFSFLRYLFLLVVYKLRR